MAREHKSNGNKQARLLTWRSDNSDCDHEKARE